MMIKRIVSISFLMLYLAFMILPGYPLMHYYVFSSHETVFSPATQQKSYSNGDLTKVGDSAYLSALMKSANADRSGKHVPNPPPSTNNEINNLVYIVSGFLNSPAQTVGVSLHFRNFAESILDQYLQVLIPPPNSQA